MAKARNYFGLRTGSTKSKTFSILNGWQIEKDRVYGGKNPRTNAQMRQRMVMATASAAYSGMREICDHSFEGVTYGQPTMSKFISENAKILKQKLAINEGYFNPYQERGIMPNDYVVSKGTLKRKFDVTTDEIEDSTVSIAMNWSSIDLQTTTIEDFYKHLGLSRDSYITFLCIAFSPSNNIHQFGYVRFYPKYERLDETVSGNTWVELFDVESNVPLFSLQETPVNTGGFVGFDFDNGEIMQVSIACIQSEKQLSWKRSTEKMLVDIKSPYTPPTPAESLATYPVGTDYVLNGGNI